jgi:hypothetical protein
MAKRTGSENLRKYYPLIVLAFVALFGYSIYLQSTAGGGGGGYYGGAGGGGGYGASITKQEAEQLLGLSGVYTAAQVKSAFREKSRGVHPDRNNSPEAQAEFIRLTEAKEFLLSTL